MTQEWTTTPPTEPGWYWVYTIAEDEPENVVTEIVWVDFPPGYYGPKFSLEEVGLLLYEKTHWLGPLPMPEHPR